MAEIVIKYFLLPKYFFKEVEKGIENEAKRKGRKFIRFRVNIEL